MKAPMLEFLRAFNLNLPATEQAIRAYEVASAVKLPDDYVDFLMMGNGGEGFIGENSYAILWRVDELGRLNSEYQVSQYASGLVLIGSDGGGEAFAYDTRQSAWPVVQVPFVGMDLGLIEVLGADFRSFLKALHSA